MPSFQRFQLRNDEIENKSAGLENNQKFLVVCFF